MSKSGSRYGRRSNWFKIHCLLQEQQQKQIQGPSNQEHNNDEPPHPHQIQMPPNQPMGMRFLGNNHFAPPLMGLPRTRDDFMMLGLGEESFRPSASPSVSSPESHNSDSSVEYSDGRRMTPVIPGFFPPNFFPHTSMLFPTGYPPFYTTLLNQPYPQSLNNNEHVNKRHIQEPPQVPTQVKREYLDAVLQMQRNTPPEEEEEENTEEVDVKTPVPNLSPVQDAPIDLSMKTMSEKESSASDSDDSSRSGRISAADEEEEEDPDDKNALDLTNKV